MQNHWRSESSPGLALIPGDIPTIQKIVAYLFDLRAEAKKSSEDPTQYEQTLAFLTDDLLDAMERAGQETHP